MTNYEFSTNYHDWHSATPRAAIRELLQDGPAQTVIIEYEGGDVAKWRRASRNEEVVHCIENSLNHLIARNRPIDVKRDAELIYDKLEQEGHLK